MRTDREAKSRAKREWKFVHFLAACTAVEVALLLIVQTLVAFMGSPIQAPVAIRVVILVVAFFLMWFWVRSSADFVRNRPEQHAAAWGWGLYLGAFLGALAYFVWIWRPRNQGDAT